jgi:aminopeptidase YwaD
MRLTDRCVVRLRRTLMMLCLAVLGSSLANSAERLIPFWPDALPQTISSAVSGVEALNTVRALGQFHRVHGSPGLAAAAEYMRLRLLAGGLADAKIERFPADGKTRYAHFRSYLGWTAIEATLDEVSPAPRRLKRFPDLPVALADYSQDADVTAEVVDVGPGTDPGDYAGKEVAGRIVLASGPLALVHRRASEERSAAGFLSDYPNQSTAWSGDDRDLVRWGHLSPYQTRNSFAFMLSRREADALRARLKAGEHVVLKAHVRAQMVPATYDVVVATIAGTEPSAGEVLLTAHLCHESAGANDNASGSAAIYEVARALEDAIDRGALPRPRRTIRFLWLPEIAGSEAYLVSHPEVVQRAVAGIHMDMVGGLLATTHGTFHLSRTAESRPHVVNAVAATWLEQVQRTSARYAERGGDPYAGLVWLPGSREAFLGDLRAIEMGSDHEVFEEASFKIPMVYFHDWPDTTIHTNKDLPENLDATKLGRAAYLGAGIAWTMAALPSDEAPRLFAVTRAACRERVVRAELEADLVADPRDGALLRREAAETGILTLQSLGSLWPQVASRTAEEGARLKREEVGVPPQSTSRVPLRNPEVRGPLAVYYYDHLTEVLGPDAITDVALTRRPGGDVLGYEALNFVDGRQSVREIRDILSGRYAPVPLAEVEEYFELLAKANVVRWGTETSPTH